MDKIYIFSGTSEGRELSTILSRNKIRHTVFVATRYGQDIMHDDPCLFVRCGRLNAAEMRRLFADERPDAVVDATHPHANEVTKNIKSALEECGLKGRYLRLMRRIEKPGEELISGNDISIVRTADEAANLLRGISDSIKGNILLTTGVNTLESFAAIEEIKERLIIRIIPSEESLEKALGLNIAPDRIIAMKGPFSRKLNEALIDSYKIGILVTKNSGERGGFQDKIRAAKNKHIKLIVIDPEEECEDGMSFEEVVRALTGTDPKSTSPMICIAGIGPGNLNYLLPVTRERIEEADLIIGAGRMISFARQINKEAEYYEGYDCEKILAELKASKKKRALVLMSGDSGFYSGTEKLAKLLHEAGYRDISILPGISSVSYLSALTGTAYSDAALISIHGTVSDIDRALRDKGKCFVLMSGRDDIERLKDYTKGHKVLLGSNLGYPDEEVICLNDEGNDRIYEEGLYIGLIC